MHILFNSVTKRQNHETTDWQWTKINEGGAVLNWKSQWNWRKSIGVVHKYSIVSRVASCMQDLFNSTTHDPYTSVNCTSRNSDSFFVKWQNKPVLCRVRNNQSLYIVQQYWFFNFYATSWVVTKTVKTVSRRCLKLQFCTRAWYL